MHSLEIISSSGSRACKSEPRHLEPHECISACDYKPSPMHMTKGKGYGEPQNWCDANKAAKTRPGTVQHMDHRWMANNWAALTLNQDWTQRTVHMRGDVRKPFGITAHVSFVNSGNRRDKFTTYFTPACLIKIWALSLGWRRFRNDLKEQLINPTSFPKST